MKKWIAAITNFFFPGLGYLLVGVKRMVGLGWLLGFVGLTYVEFSIQKPLPQVYWIMFGCVFLINTMFAIDSYREVKEVTEGAYVS